MFINKMISEVTKEKKNDNCIFFAISNDYSFAVANVIMSLYKNSRNVIENCDVIIFHDGLSDENRNLLSLLHARIIFVLISFPGVYCDILNHKTTLKWGAYVICTLYGFDLIKYYDKVLHLDADVFVNGDIKGIFDTEAAISWRRIIAADPQKVFKDINKRNDYVSIGNGGVVFFSNVLAKYDIGSNDIIYAFDVIKNLKDCGIDEKILAYLAYYKGLQIKELDISYNAPVRMCSPQNYKDMKIIHFLPHRGVITKPWQNLVSYLYFTEWAKNYNQWIALGGDGPINYKLEDYYNLFKFEDAELIKKLKTIVSKL